MNAEREKQLDMWDWTFRGDVHRPRPEFIPVVEDLLSEYATMSDSDRNELWAFLSERHNLANAIDCYTNDAIQRLKETGDTKYLRLGLLAAALADFPHDYRDTSLALARLVVAAERLGHAPEPLLNEVAAIASPAVSRGGHVPMRKFLRTFMTSSVVKEERMARLQQSG